MQPIIIYPCKFGNINKIDSDYKFEQEVAEEIGFKTVTFNYDNFVWGEKLKISKLEETESSKVTAIYRGWMLKVNDYKRLYNELSSIDINLITTPEQYESTHIFVNSYNNIKDFTPKTIWFNDKEAINWDKVQKELGEKFIVKDYVKSVKGFDFPEYLSSNMTNEELNSYIEKFKQLRGDLYTGGIVLKQYVELDKSNGHTHEFRIFFINGESRLIYPNSNNSEDITPYTKSIELDQIKLNSSFYTIDIAQLKNGEYTIIEIGDGQVSGIPSKDIAYKLYKEIMRASIRSQYI